MRVTIAQINSTNGDIAGNVRKIVAAIEKARSDGSDLVVFPEIITHGETGMLSNKGDAEGLADNLEKLIQEPALRKELNTKARAWIDREFSVKAMVGGNLSVYRELLGKAF